MKANTQYSEADYQALRDVIAYAKNEEKTEREFFCDGINCNITTARDEFITVKEQFGKTDGIQAYHGYMSFKERNITPELAHKVGMEFAQKVWGDRYQVVVTTHLNTQHLHCHFVINSVSFVDGKRCRDTSWFKFYKLADEICRKYELHTIEKPERNPDSRYLTKKDQAGMPTRYNIARAAIDEAISMSTNRYDFERALHKMGYAFNGNPNHKYFTITIKDDKKPIRLYRLGEKYTMSRIEERLRENQRDLKFIPFHPGVPKPRQYVLDTREMKLRRVGGLRGLYLHYCYRLGYLPQYTHPKPNRVHYLLRADLMKLDQLTAQTKLLCKHRIGTAEELFDYKTTVEKTISCLTAERTHLRNDIRKVNIPGDRLSAEKTQIEKITGQLKKLREEVKLCNQIAERSGLMQEKLDKVITEEKGKERRNHEHERGRGGTGRQTFTGRI